MPSPKYAEQRLLRSEAFDYLRAWTQSYRVKPGPCFSPIAGLKESFLIYLRQVNSELADKVSPILSDRTFRRHLASEFPRLKTRRHRRMGVQVMTSYPLMPRETGPKRFSVCSECGSVRLIPGAVVSTAELLEAMEVIDGKRSHTPKA